MPGRESLINGDIGRQKKMLAGVRLLGPSVSKEAALD
jgi:hypothetical protein